MPHHFATVADGYNSNTIGAVPGSVSAMTPPAVYPSTPSLPPSTYPMVPPYAPYPPHPTFNSAHQPPPPYPYGFPDVSKPHPTTAPGGDKQLPASYSGGNFYDFQNYNFADETPYATNHVIPYTAPPAKPAVQQQTQYALPPPSHGVPSYGAVNLGPMPPQPHPKAAERRKQEKQTRGAKGSGAPQSRKKSDPAITAAKPGPSAGTPTGVMCCYHKKGDCKKGADCWYSHDGGEDTPCHYGVKCAAGHAELSKVMKRQNSEVSSEPSDSTSTPSTPASAAQRFPQAPPPPAPADKKVPMQTLGPYGPEAMDAPCRFCDEKQGVQYVPFRNYTSFGPATLQYRIQCINCFGSWLSEV